MAARGQGPIFLTVLLDLVGFGMVIPLLPLYAEAFHASGLVIGMLAASYSVMQFVFNPVWGRLSDRVGRRPVLLASIAGSVVSMALLGAASSLWMLFAARILAGIAGANIAAAHAYVADITQPEDRARGMGRIGMALGLGFILGPFFGGIVSRWGHGMPGLCASGLSAIAFVWAFFRLPESLSPEFRGDPRRIFSPAQFRRALGRARTGLPIVLFFSVTFGFTGLEMAFSLFAKNRLGFSPMEIGFLFAAVGLAMAVTQGFLLGPLQRRFGEHRLAFTGVLFLALGIGALPMVATHEILRIVDVFLITFGAGINSPSLTSLVSRGSDLDGQGATLGVHHSMASLARATGPFWAGWVYGAAGPSAPFVSAGVIIAIAWIVLGFPLLRLGVARTAK